MSLDWDTDDELLAARIDMLSEDLVIRTFNSALKMYGSTPDLREILESFTWVTMGDDHVCELCSNRENKTWKPGQFMPMLPAHLGCRCSFDVLLE